MFLVFNFSPTSCITLCCSQHSSLECMSVQFMWTFSIKIPSAPVVLSNGHAVKPNSILLAFCYFCLGPSLFHRPSLSPFCDSLRSTGKHVSYSLTLLTLYLWWSVWLARSHSLLFSCSADGRGCTNDHRCLAVFYTVGSIENIRLEG